MWNNLILGKCIQVGKSQVDSVLRIISAAAVDVVAVAVVAAADAVAAAAVVAAA